MGENAVVPAASDPSKRGARRKKKSIMIYRAEKKRRN